MMRSGEIGVSYSIRMTHKGECAFPRLLDRPRFNRDAAMASARKCLARNNKSLDEVRSTQEEKGGCSHPAPFEMRR